MNRLVNALIMGLVICLYCPSAAIAQSETGKLLDELNLGSTQRAEINAVLTGGMQSLNAINTELLKLEKMVASATEKNRSEYEQMRTNLVQQRFRLVQSMASDILSVLDDKQLSKLDFGHLLETVPKNSDNSAGWERGL